MITESVPLQIYIRQSFDTKEIKAVTDQWRVETGQLMNIVISHLNEIGVYSVAPNNEKFMKEVILAFLNNSPEIIKLVHEAERRERMLARTKKSLSD